MESRASNHILVLHVLGLHVLARIAFQLLEAFKYAAGFQNSIDYFNDKVSRDVRALVILIHESMMMCSTCFAVEDIRAYVGMRPFNRTKCVAVRGVRTVAKIRI